MTTKFVGDENGNLKELHTIQIERKVNEIGQKIYEPIPGTERVFPAQLALIAIGFDGPEHTIVDELGLETDRRTNVKARYGKFQTSAEKVFAAGDMRRGQSLVVWAINEGRDAAREVDKFLMGASVLV
jgi:glutamate synthase (NADPH) small chain